MSIWTRGIGEYSSAHWLVSHLPGIVLLHFTKLDMSYSDRTKRNIKYRLSLTNTCHCTGRIGIFSCTLVSIAFVRSIAATFHTLGAHALHSLLSWQVYPLSHMLLSHLPLPESESKSYNKFSMANFSFMNLKKVSHVHGFCEDIGTFWKHYHLHF